MILKFKPLYKFIATESLASQCKAIERQPQLHDRVSASAINLLAIPFLLCALPTATFDMYAIPVLSINRKINVIHG